MPIPRIIHQTYRTRTDAKLGPLMDSWQTMNPTWSYRFYNDDDCLAFVTKHFPQYLHLYQVLPKGAPRADLFRYLVVLQDGGVYVDADTKCLVPLDQWKGANWDSANAVFEYEFPAGLSKTAAVFIGSTYPFQQVMQFFFAAEPQNPGIQQVVNEVVTNIKMMFAKGPESTVLSNDAILDTTGPWAFTRALQPFQGAPGYVWIGYHEWETKTFKHICAGSWRIWGSARVGQMDVQSMALSTFVIIVLIGLIVYATRKMWWLMVSVSSLGLLAIVYANVWSYRQRWGRWTDETNLSSANNSS